MPRGKVIPLKSKGRGTLKLTQPDRQEDLRIVQGAQSEVREAVAQQQALLRRLGQLARLLPGNSNIRTLQSVLPNLLVVLTHTQEDLEVLRNKLVATNPEPPSVA